MQMNGQLGLWTAAIVAIAWFLAAVMVQTLSARHWWWLLGETGLAVLAHDWGWWGLERLRFRWTTGDNGGLLLATGLSMGAIAVCVLLLSQVVFPGMVGILKRSQRKTSPTLPPGTPSSPGDRDDRSSSKDADSAPQPATSNTLPRRRRWELVLQALLVTVANLAWGGALGLYAPP